VEWNIGEAAGALAVWSLANDATPRGVRNDELRLKDFQATLTTQLGFELAWPNITAPS
jgi:hypothetical protein